MANEPSISVREWIRWIPDEASEPTSTLVLTSSGRRFVDIRILKPTQPGEPELPNEGGPMTRLDWAFAGTSHSRIIPPEEPLSSSDPSSTSSSSSPPPVPRVHSTWTHWIDSTTDGAVTDEGDMEPQADGIHVLEKGAMVNPATGQMTAYEEFWADLRAERIGGVRWCVVLVLEDEGAGAKGMVVRVGEWCQGIVKVRGEVSVERWRWSGDGEGGGEDGAGKQDWKRVAKLGGLFLPCSVAFKPEEIHVGSTVTYGDYKWQVQELSSW